MFILRSVNCIISLKMKKSEEFYRSRLIFFNFLQFKENNKRTCYLFAKITYAEADVAACCVASKSILLVKKNKIEFIDQK